MSKKKKRVEIQIHVPEKFAEHEEVVVVPVPPPEAAVAPAPLVAAVKLQRCALTVCEPFWGSSYVVLSAAPGSALPDHLMTGQVVDVSFSPVSDDAPPLPHN